MCGDFLKNRTAQRLGVYGCFLKKVINMMYKTRHKETQRKQTISQSTQKNDLLKATMFQRHEDYHGFVKTGFENKLQSRHTHTQNFEHFGATWSILVPFWIPSDFEGVPKSTIFEQKYKKNEKKEVQEPALKKHDLLIDF